MPLFSGAVPGAGKVVATDRSELALFELEQDPAWARRRRIAPSRGLADITDARQHATLIDAHSVTDIIHTAAHKHVSFMEDAALAAVENNVWGTRTLLEVAVARVRRFTFVSTDKAVLPESVLWATVMWGEVLIAHFAQRQAEGQGSGQEQPCFSTIRLGNVLGSAGSALDRFQAQIEQGGPVTVRDPGLERYFITMPQPLSAFLRPLRKQETARLMSRRWERRCGSSTSRAGRYNSPVIGPAFPAMPRVIFRSSSPRCWRVKSCGKPRYCPLTCTSTPRGAA